MTLLSDLPAVWQRLPVSELSVDARRPCCRLARTWFRAMARTHASLEPSWLSSRWTWGPHPWPIFWCQAVKRSTLDCGALAALADEHMSAVASKPLRVQLAMSYSREACQHWAATWRAAGIEPWWIFEHYVYHEAVAASNGRGQLKIWDPSETMYLSAGNSHSGRVVALQMRGDVKDDAVYWSGQKIPIERWVAIASSSTSGGRRLGG